MCFFSTLDIQQVIIGEQVPSKPQEQSRNLDPELPRIKEEVEELWSSQEGAQLQGPAPVKSDDDDEKAQSSHLQSKQGDEGIKAEAAGKECKGSEPVGMLRMLVKRRLTSAVEEMLGLFETTVAEYEEEIQGLHKLLEETVKPEVRVNTTGLFF